MCLITRNLEKYVAEEDIKVWKVLTTENTSPFYRDFSWKEGETYDSELEVIPRTTSGKSFTHYICVEAGFHFLTSYTLALNFMDVSLNFIKEVYNLKMKIVEMIIPKGASYYINSTEIVSDKVYFPKQEEKNEQNTKHSE
jgi:hypothetical protein